jgi:hypothetical protein
MNCELMLTYDTPALRQTGSRNLTGQKTLPTIWGTYIKLVTKYQILSALLIFIHIEHICSFFVAFFSATIDGRNLIFGHKLHIGTPYRGKHCWTHQIPTSCLPNLLIFIHIEHTTEKNATKNILDGRTEVKQYTPLPLRGAGV